MLLDVRSKIYYVTPPDVPDPAELLRLVRCAVHAGVGVVQYRAKTLSGARMYRDLCALLGLTRAAGVPLIVNDRVDLALAAGADGVHVGQEDLPARVARRLLGPKAIIGVTADTARQVRHAEADGATYVACGAVFPSPTKPQEPVIGLQGVQAVQRVAHVPVCVIGGIHAQNLHELRPLNPELVAVISAINQAPDPGAAARELVELSRQVLTRPRIGP